MTDQPRELPQVDEPPRSGEFIDHDELQLTDDEVRDGNLLGEAIDVDDDHDNGLQYVGGPPR